LSQEELAKNQEDLAKKIVCQATGKVYNTLDEMVNDPDYKLVNFKEVKMAS